MDSTQLEFGRLPPRIPLLRALRETPALRVTQSGAKNVSLLELLGTVIGDADVALRLLAQFPTIDDLARAPASELGVVKGMGQARIAALQASIELGHVLAGVTSHRRDRVYRNRTTHVLVLKGRRA